MCVCRHSGERSRTSRTRQRVPALTSRTRQRVPAGALRGPHFTVFFVFGCSLQGHFRASSVHGLHFLICFGFMSGSLWITTLRAPKHWMLPPRGRIEYSNVRTTRNECDEAIKVKWRSRNVSRALKPLRLRPTVFYHAEICSDLITLTEDLLYPG